MTIMRAHSRRPCTGAYARQHTRVQPLWVLEFSLRMCGGADTVCLTHSKCPTIDYQNHPEMIKFAKMIFRQKLL